MKLSKQQNYDSGVAIITKKATVLTVRHKSDKLLSYQMTGVAEPGGGGGQGGHGPPKI